MVDLNDLIPPGSSLELVYGEHINDRGEILGIGVPAGVAPIDVETKGHAFVLIPDEDNINLSAWDSTSPVDAQAANISAERKARARAAAKETIEKYLQTRQSRINPGRLQKSTKFKPE
jgi:hypothetical protein